MFDVKQVGYARVCVACVNSSVELNWNFIDQILDGFSSFSLRLFDFLFFELKHEQSLINLIEELNRRFQTTRETTKRNLTNFTNDSFPQTKICSITNFYLKYV